ncbi:MAG: S8 family peptidase [Archangium sp.]
MNFNTRFTAVALLSAVVATPSFAQSVQPPYSSNGTKERPCSNERFTLEVPLHAPAFVPTFEANFAAIMRSDGWWFCTGPSCPTTYRARLTASLPMRSTGVPAERLDGHRRSYLVNFESWNGKEWVAETPGPMATCDVIKRLRTSAAKAQGVAEPSSTAKADVLVSRSCNVVGQDVEAHALPTTLEWADSRIAARPWSTLGSVELALVDTGVPSTSRWDVGVSGEEDLPAYEATSKDYHPHGTHMAGLIHAVAPNAKIHSFRALDENGMGSLSALAHATDAALFKSGINRGPLVVNLSVGAPPSLFVPSQVISPTGCSTWEDPAGEALRYVLHVASVMDAQGPAVFVAAASGNLPLERIAQNDGMGAMALAPDRCGAMTGSLSSSFFPASLGEVPSCVTPSTAKWLNVLPVGASNYDDAPSSLTIQSAQVRLYAPGERVYARGATTTVEPHYSCTDVELKKGFQLPSAVSGTSAATALVSASAAHLLGRLPWGTTTSPRAADVSRLLYVTGQPMCVGPKARRIHLGRADDAVKTPSAGCQQLLTCIASMPHTGPALTDSTGYLCRTEMNACFGAAAELACPVPTQEPGWTKAAIDEVPRTDWSCRRAWGVTSSAPSPRLTGALSRYSGQQLAGIGPQPSGGACQACMVIADPARMVLRYELSDAFPAGTRFTDAYVALLSVDKEVKYFIPVRDGREWRPGEVGEMMLDLSLVDDAEAVISRLLHRELTPVFDIGERPVRGEESRNISPLGVERP